MRQEIEDLCKNAGVKVLREYEQDKDPINQSDEMTKGGWCAGMACQYLISSKETNPFVSLPFWSKWDKGDLINSVRFVTAFGEVESRKGGYAYAAFYRTVLKKNGLTSNNELINDRPNKGKLKGSDIYIAMGRMNGRLIIIEIWGNKYAHAMALVKNNQSMRFMDPNSGEFLMESRTAARGFFTDYFKIMNYHENDDYFHSFRMESFD